MTRDSEQLYLLDTNILLTRFLSPAGVAEISDFMPVSIKTGGHAEQDTPTQLVRRAKTVRGELRYRMVCAPRFDYARATHHVEQRSDREFLFIGEGDCKTRPAVAFDGCADAHGERRRRGGVTFCAATRRRPSCWRKCATAKTSACEAEHFVADSFKRDDEFLARLDGAQHVQGPLARDGQPFRADCSSC